LRAPARRSCGASGDTGRMRVRQADWVAPHSPAGDC
jgi:hypothetical protein